ncbi:MAG: hypothetical protein HY737_05715 [Candidatus Omnitrophica bacterium]|nr:hypothetical protein [Candidatus Omnitrophota bacterium]
MARLTPQRVLRLLAPLAGLAVAGLALAQSEETPEERRARWDQGPQTIDISAYPPEMQQRYELFAQKCAKCHNLSRPINAEFTPQEWEGYLDKMMRKKGSEVGKKDKREIYEFLVYDTQIRKPQYMTPPSGDQKGQP